MERTGSVSMQDVAKEAGVSPQTVSRVANGSDAVRPQTRRKVQEAMERELASITLADVHEDAQKYIQM